jgi:hypothetical protein
LEQSLRPSQALQAGRQQRFAVLEFPQHGVAFLEAEGSTDFSRNGNSPAF